MKKRKPAKVRNLIALDLWSGKYKKRVVKDKKKERAKNWARRKDDCFA